jgi:hypothetical protein
MLLTITTHVLLRNDPNVVLYPQLRFADSNYYLLWIIIISLCCTNGALFGFVWCLNQLIFFTVIITTNLEPMILSIIILHENTNPNPNLIDTTNTNN